MLSNQTITRDEFLDIVRPWFESIGTKPENAVSLELGRDGIKVAVYRTDDHGNRIRGLLGFITDVYNIAISEEPCDDPNSLCNPRKSDVLE